MIKTFFLPLFLILFLLILIVKFKCNKNDIRINNKNLNGKLIRYVEKDIYKKKSKYQNIEISNISYPKNLGLCLTIDEEIQLCSSNEHIYHEMMVHFPIAYLPKIENVLIIGGGDMMNIRELLKYKSIKKIDFCEIDIEIINTCIKYLNVKDYTKDPRVNLILGDAKDSVNNRPSSFYDLIIIDLTQNDNENSDKLISKNFIKLLKSKLEKNGIVIINGSHFDILKNNFKYKKRLYTYLDYFDDYYSYYVASDIYNFTKFHPSHKIKTPSGLKYYNPDNHLKNFNWFTFQNNK